QRYEPILVGLGDEGWPRALLEFRFVVEAILHQRPYRQWGEQGLSDVRDRREGADQDEGTVRQTAGRLDRHAAAERFGGQDEARRRDVLNVPQPVVCRVGGRVAARLAGAAA